MVIERKALNKIAGIICAIFITITLISVVLMLSPNVLTKHYGGELLKVDTFYPSSQTCFVCGYQNIETKNLGVREWTCPKCGTHHDRDINATKNILRKALEDKSKAA